jgi:thioredoxin 1
MSEIVDLDHSNFEEEVREASGPVVVEFVTDWCETCEALDETVEQMSDEYAETVKVGRVAVDEQGRLANNHQIADVPTFIVFFRGNVLKRKSGEELTADDVEALFEYLADLPKVAA